MYGLSEDFLRKKADRPPPLGLLRVKRLPSLEWPSRQGKSGMILKDRIG